LPKRPDISPGLENEKIAHAAQEWRATFDAIRDPLWICDKKCNLVRVNKSFAESAGSEPKAIIGKNCSDVLNYAQVICPRCPHKNTLTSGQLNSEVFLLGDRYIEITASPVFDDKSKTISSVCIAHDTTQSRLMEEALRSAAQKWRATFDGIKDAICLTDKDGGIAQCNQAFSQLVAKPFFEILGQDARLLLKSRSNSGGSFSLDTIRVNRKRQSLTLSINKRWFNMVADPVVGEDNKFHGLVLILSDITETKRASEKLQELYRLETKLRRELEEEIQRRVEFTRALVHELKTPLTPIVASSELLAEELSAEPWASLAKNINSGAANLNRRIDELLDLARGEVGMLKLKTQPVDCNILFAEILKYMNPVAAGNKQTLLARFKHLPVIEADEDRLRQVLFNLLNNALKYTPAGGKIVLKAGIEKQNIIVEVQDSGSGISEEDQAKLFQPYQRLDGDRQRFSGLGLGLVLAKRLIELHGGKIWVRSAKGNGSTFAFSIPLDGNIPSKSGGKH
jgi:PAS domain S-box-containing protein